MDGTSAAGGATASVGTPGPRSTSAPRCTPSIRGCPATTASPAPTRCSPTTPASSRPAPPGLPRPSGMRWQGWGSAPTTWRRSSSPTSTWTMPVGSVTSPGCSRTPRWSCTRPALGTSPTRTAWWRARGASSAASSTTCSDDLRPTAAAAVSALLGATGSVDLGRRAPSSRRSTLRGTPRHHLGLARLAARGPVRRRRRRHLDPRDRGPAARNATAGLRPRARGRVDP